MTPRRSYLLSLGIALFCGAAVSAPMAFARDAAPVAQPTIPPVAPPVLTVRVDLTGTEPPAGEGADTSLFAAWEIESPVAVPVALPVETMLTAASARDNATGSSYVAVRNESGAPQIVKTALHLPAGLWRVDAAVMLPGDTEPRRWRMESVPRTLPGDAGKTVTIPAGATLCLRVTDTLRAARLALKAARVSEREGGTTYAGASVAGDLNRIGALLDSLPARIAGGKWDAVATQTHKALLYAAQAMAMTQNGRDATLEDTDPIFEALTTTLSEISLAALKGTPGQRRVTLADGRDMVEITFTNGGRQTLPLIALGLTGGRDSQKVYRGVPVGGRIVARFPAAPDTEPGGAVQIHLGGSSLRFVGTAVVPALPAP